MTRSKAAMLGLSLVFALCGAAGADDPEEEAFPTGSGDGANLFSMEMAFSCSVQCGDNWVSAGECTGSQTCCGYVYCSTGVSQIQCCNVGTHCNWNGVGRPPAMQCLPN